MTLDNMTGITKGSYTGQGGDAEVNETKSPYMQQSRHDDGRMTREEAIKLIDTHTVCFYNEIDSPTLQALHLAIEALSVIDIVDLTNGNTITKAEYDAVSREDTVTLNSPISIQAEMVTVVRCKDCKHYIVEGITTQYGWCHEYKHSVDEDDYCSYGERREE